MRVYVCVFYCYAVFGCVRLCVCVFGGGCESVSWKQYLRFKSSGFSSTLCVHRGSEHVLLCCVVLCWRGAQ